MKKKGGILPFFDRWDSDRTPEDWLKFYKDEKGHHGVCSVEVNQKM